ncbi:dimethylaniline monooxygenase [n-oxide-forming] [Plakobranchus ocellatus]|uniref:Flavin-containing monooxygenase n=1 Tax=Plakobranchus ocellatus TaxID=259542 RepID=A0AAV4C496_9GAST|nr:dimethylaniline monooxygenase [n-oxide-forming] [Plakobranchus ocellatus]
MFSPDNSTVLLSPYWSGRQTAAADADHQAVTKSGHVVSLPPAKVKTVCLISISSTCAKDLDGFPRLGTSSVRAKSLKATYSYSETCCPNKSEQPFKLNRSHQSLPMARRSSSMPNTPKEMHIPAFSKDFLAVDDHSEPSTRTFLPSSLSSPSLSSLKNVHKDEGSQCLSLANAKPYPSALKSQNLTSVSTQRVLIIGAGCSGLAAIKTCLDEGLIPVCLERSSDIGGLWNYTDIDHPGNAGIYRSLVINTSKEMMMFSDFPPPETFPPFLTHDKVLEYFRLYVKHFGLRRYIHFNTEVLKVSRADDYESTGRWRVRANISGNDDTSNAIFDDLFDGVMVCSGHHSVPYIPHIPGLPEFRGEVMHSRFYKESSPFVGKKVVILGMGNSAVDIACDLAKSAEKVYLSSRRGAWIVPRTSFWGWPADMLANSRVVFTLPYRLLDWFVQVQANVRVDHNAYGLRPQHGVLNCHPTINDELPIHLVSGRVQTKPSIARTQPDGVLLDNGEFLPCDVIILATGYDYRVDFVNPKDLEVESNKSCLYKFMIPPHHPHPTFTVIGLIQAIGAVMPISEIQTRWAAKLITGASKLPSRAEMEQDYHDKRNKMAQLYVESRRHSMQTFWIDYMDQVASKIGAKPNLWKYLLTDPELALKCYFGPCLPAQYRLVGPNAWPKAREFILEVFSRASRTRTGSRPVSSERQISGVHETFSNTQEAECAKANMPNWTIKDSGIKCCSESQEVARYVPENGIYINNKQQKDMKLVQAPSTKINQTPGSTISHKTNHSFDKYIDKIDKCNQSDNSNAVGEKNRSFWLLSSSSMHFNLYMWAILVCFVALGLSRLLGSAESLFG